MDKMDQTNVLKVIAEFEDNKDTRDAFREVLEHQREEHRKNREFMKAASIGRIIRRERVFELAYRHAIDVAASQYVHSAEFGDGDFAKWFLDWFANGGWEVIIEFIKALIPLFGGLI